MSRLLDKPFKSFTIYALIVLGCSIPAYFMLVEYIWMAELDEHNQIIKERIENRFSDAQLSDYEILTMIDIWNVIQPDTKITPAHAAAIKSDHYYTIKREHQYANDSGIDRFRGLIAYFYIRDKPYQIVVETNIEESEETLLAIAIVTVLFFIILVFGFIILNKRIARNIWQPFRNTLDKVKAFDLNKDKDIQFAETEIEEFQELNYTLTKLIKNNISIFHQQKTFIENASHELQTPLAILKSKVDLLLQNEHLTKNQSEIINSISIPLSRVSRINKNLLLLSKIENQQFAEKEQVEVITLLNTSIELLTDYIVDKNITIYKKIEGQQVVYCNKTLLEILLTNLLTNAIRHNNQNGIIKIELRNHIIIISNTGEVALDNHTLFQRFVVSSAKTTSSGLGLAIVKEICNRYNWKVSYIFESDWHHFSVQF